MKDRFNNVSILKYFLERFSSEFKPSVSYKRTDIDFVFQQNTETEHKVKFLLCVYDYRPFFY